MSAQSEPAIHLAGEYLVANQGSGQGLDHYLQVVGPDGRATDQKVYWTYSKTPHQVAEEAVAAHLGHHVEMRRTAPTRESPDGGYIVTVDERW